MTPSPTTNPTAEAIFGANPWQTDAGGSMNGISYGYSKYYFATPTAAKQVADMLGGTVVEEYSLGGGPPTQNKPNELVLLPGGQKVNAGLIMQVWTHGYPENYIDQVVSQIVGFIWSYKAPPPPPLIPLQPADGLMMAAIGDVAMQADGTVWKRVS